MTLADFVDGFNRLLEPGVPEPIILSKGRALLEPLVQHDDWLPVTHAQPGPDYYRQYSLHRDPAGRFSVVSFVWGPGQFTPIHDHTVWGLIGVLRGAEYSQAYILGKSGAPVPSGERTRLDAGQVAAVSPSIGDIHQVHNAFQDRISVSIHVYGGDIGTIERSVYASDGQRKTFVSGYSPVT